MACIRCVFYREFQRCFFNPGAQLKSVRTMLLEKNLTTMMIRLRGYLLIYKLMLFIGGIFTVWSTIREPLVAVGEHWGKKELSIVGDCPYDGWLPIPYLGARLWKLDIERPKSKLAFKANFTFFYDFRTILGAYVSSKLSVLSAWMSGSITWLAWLFKSDELLLHNTIGTKYDSFFLKNCFVALSLLFIILFRHRLIY